MFTGISEAISALTTAKETFLIKFAVAIRESINIVHNGVLIKTPVWSGETINNYHWGVDSMSGGGLRAAVGSGDPGATSSMALGSEPRRGPNTAGVNAEKSSLAITKNNMFHEYILYNMHPKAEDLEYGMLPEPGRSRSPSGMIRLTEAELMARLGVLLNVS